MVNRCLTPEEMALEALINGLYLMPEKQEELQRKLDKSFNKSLDKAFDEFFGKKTICPICPK